MDIDLFVSVFYSIGFLNINLQLNEPAIHEVHELAERKIESVQIVNELTTLLFNYHAWIYAIVIFINAESFVK